RLARNPNRISKSEILRFAQNDKGKQSTHLTSKQSRSGLMDNNPGGQQGQGSQDLSGVRSGDLVPHEERALPKRMEDSTAISPGRAIPPAEITSLLDRYRHVDPEEAMIPVF